MQHAFAHPYLPQVELDIDALDHLRAQEPLPTARSHRDLLCGYRSKVCMNVRARKRNGTLHRFCELHRQQANANQKRWMRRHVAPVGAATRANTDLELQLLELAYRTSYERLLVAAVSDYLPSIDTHDAPDGQPSAAMGEINFGGSLSGWIDTGDQAALASLTDLDAMWKLLDLDEFAIGIGLTC